MNSKDAGKKKFDPKVEAEEKKAKTKDKEKDNAKGKLEQNKPCHCI